MHEDGVTRGGNEIKNTGHSVEGVYESGERRRGEGSRGKKGKSNLPSAIAFLNVGRQRKHAGNQFRVQRGHVVIF